jgi:predicted RNA binding protein YcfA (HicA-like mRNA interferase family)
MSPKFPALAANEVTRVLRKHGFKLIKQRGSHQKWRHDNGMQVIVPVHGTKIIPIGTLKSIIDGSGLKIEDFQK